MFSKLIKIKRFLSKRVLAAAVLGLAAVLVLTLSAFSQLRTVTVNADGTSITLTTTAKTVSGAVSECGITLMPGDELSPGADLEPVNDMVISVSRAFPVSCIDGTTGFTINTVSKPLKDVLEAEGIVLNEHDLVTPSPDTVVTPDTNITITRVLVNDISEFEALPYSKEFVANSSMERNDSEVLVKGAEGVQEAVYRVTVTNGAETSRELIREAVIKAPVTEVVEYGTKPDNSISSSTTSETAAVLADCSFIDCKAYSYIIHGKTATGMKTKRGLIAVDPKVIPLGTRVYVQSLDGKPDYGYAIAADTGGSIKGNIIDMWVPTYSEAAQNGVRKMRVYILPD